jgi:hypothetical protein
VAWLREQAEVRAIDLHSSDVLRRERWPHAVLFLQARPGEISQTTIERLHSASPLARLVALVGVFGEGELRSGSPFQGVARVYWHQWAERLPRELGLGQSEVRRRARTATDADELLRLLAPGAQNAKGRGLAAICTYARNDFESLADACALAGWSSVWHQPGRSPQYLGANLLLVDGAPALKAMELEPGAIGLPTILLASFPRPEENSNPNIGRILARPFLATDLLEALRAVAAGGSQTACATSAA